MVAASEGLLAMLTVSNTSFGALTGARSGGLGHLVLALLWQKPSVAWSSFDAVGDPLASSAD